MTPLIVFVITIFACSIGFVIGAFWATVGTANKEYDAQIKVCDRCGNRFSTEDSEDNIICQRCVEFIKNNPDDEYMKKWRYE